MRRLLIGVTSSLVVAVLAVYTLCFHYTPYGTVGIMRDITTGVVSLDHPGMNFTAPWVRVAKMPTTPVRVCVSSASRAYNCKLVQFEPSTYEEFVATEGFRYYWWDNRFSYNGGYDDEYRGAKDLLRGYTFSAKTYPFVTVLNDYVPE